MFAKQLVLAAAALGGVILTGTAVAADDGETKTLLKNSYQQSAEVSCAGAQTDCAVQFPPMTDAKTLITAVSCSVFVTPGSIVGFALSDFGTTTSVFLPAFVFSQSSNAPLQAATNATVNLLLVKGEQAAVVAVVSNGGQFSAVNGLRCMISGYHTQ